MDPCVVLNMLLHFGGFLGLLVVRGGNIVPRKFAQPMQAEPRPPHGEVVQRFGFILKTGQQVMDLIHEDKPGFIVLRTFGGESVAALLGKRFLGQVFRNFHPLDLHADVVHEGRVTAEFAREVFLHVAHALTHDHAKAFTSRHLVN